MRRRVLIASLAGSLAFTTMGAQLQAAPERTGDFALLDTQGKFHQLSRYQHVKGVVIIAVGSDCPALAGALETFSDLATRYRTHGFEFLLLNGQPESNKHQRILSEGETGTSSSALPVLEDSAQLVSEALSIQQVGEVRVINPQRLTLAYRGAPGPELEQSLIRLEQGAASRADTIVTGLQTGCALDYPVRDRHKLSAPDYASQIAPLIIEKCSECHRQGGVGPFAIDSYLSLLGWSPMIREVLLNRRMPPTQIDTRIGHSPDARVLSDAQMQTLIHWFDAGAPRGDSETDPLVDYQYEQPQWLAGEPDLIMTAPPHTVPVSGLMDYVYAELELPTTEDRWLRAVQFMPQSVGTLHHLMAFATAPDEDFWGAEKENPVAVRHFLGAFSPGRPRLISYPEGTAVRLPAGHKLSLQFHYIPNGIAWTDETQIGLYFSDSPPAHELLTAAVSARDFVISAEAPETPVQATHLFSEDVVITAVRPRMGYRGKYMRFSLQQADAPLNDFFSVPAYNYGWQPHYTLQEPLLAPAGSQLILSGAFDNSISNPANPDPSREIKQGFGSENETFTGYVTFYRQN